LELGRTGWIVGTQNKRSRRVSQKFIWWKVVLGFVLIYVEIKQLLLPGARALQPDNATQAASMLFVECMLLLLGLWLVFSGLKGKQNPN
jgi:hypothetical protein